MQFSHNRPNSKHTTYINLAILFIWGSDKHHHSQFTFLATFKLISSIASVQITSVVSIVHFTHHYRNLTKELNHTQKLEGTIRFYATNSREYHTVHGSGPRVLKSLILEPQKQYSTSGIVDINNHSKRQGTPQTF